MAKYTSTNFTSILYLQALCVASKTSTLVHSEYRSALGNTATQISRAKPDDRKVLVLALLVMLVVLASTVTGLVRKARTKEQPQL